MRAMNSQIPAILFLVGLLACTPAEHPVEKSPSERMGNHLRTKIKTGRGIANFTCRQEILCGSSVIPAFYQRRGYAPAWSGRDGHFLPADSLLATIRESEREGLTPHDYHLATIESLLSGIRGKQTAGEPFDPDEASDLDLLLTDAFLLFCIAPTCLRGA
jgi:hypothetical protein